MEAQVLVIASVAGAIISGLISLLKRWVVVSRFWNYVIAFAVTVLVVLIWDLLANGTSGWVMDFPGKVAVMFTASQLVYGLVIKELGIDEKLEAKGGE